MLWRFRRQLSSPFPRPLASKWQARFAYEFDRRPLVFALPRCPRSSYCLLDVDFFDRSC
jgi:hypothetical protein